MRIQGNANTLKTNVVGASKKFGIGNAAKIIGILRDKLYENKIQTLVQEYICNARDAMREVKKGNKFEITVPTRLNPVFKVKDFGPGLSPDRVENVFIMYGSSTKEETDEQTGGFGIGAKSAWSYTDSFTIVSVFEGVRRSYVAHTGSSNEGNLDLVSTDPSDEPNGVEIQVAVQPDDIEEFRKSIFRAIHFWDDKPKLKGELNPPKLVKGEVVSDLVEVIDADTLPDYLYMGYSDSAMAVIDGIPYPLSGNLSRKVESFSKLKNLLRKRIVFHFGNGVVEVSASRESISDSLHTLNSLEKLIGRAFLEVQTHISDAFAKVTTNAEYLSTYSEMSKCFNVDKYAKFGAYTIEDSRIKSPLLKKVRITSISCLNRRGHRVQKVTKTEFSEGRREVRIENLNDLFHQINPETKIKQNKRVRAFLDLAPKNNGDPVKSTLLLIEPLLIIEYKDDKDKDGKPIRVETKRYYDTASFDQVIKDLGVKDLQTITYVDPPKVVKAKIKREDAAICLHTLDRARHTYTTLATNKQKWLYVPMKEGSWGNGFGGGSLKELDQFLREDTDFMVCGIAEKALKQVTGDPNFSLLKDWLDAYKPSKSVIAYVKREVATSSDLIGTLKKVKGNIKDTFLKDMVDEYDSMNGKISLVPLPIAIKVKACKEVNDFADLETRFKRVMKNDYPLVKDLEYCSQKEEIAFYINAKFNKKGK